MSMGLYLLAGGLGVPWFTNGGHGFGAPSFGYVIGFVVAATVVGLIAGRGGDRTVLAYGRDDGARHPDDLRGRRAVAGARPALGFARPDTLGARPFFVGDAVKILLAAGVLPGAWAVVRKVRGEE